MQKIDSQGRLAGHSVVVTGAASGIGEGTARLIVEQGGQVVLADVQLEKAEALAAELGASATAVACDVTAEADIAQAIDQCVDTFGKLDGLVNNAGIVGAVGPIADISSDAYDLTMSILARATFLGCKHAARVMVPQGSGAIVSLASTAGILGGLGPHVYTMAKHAVVGLTKSVASELASSGIRVNAVAPGNTVSAMTSAVITGDADQKDKTAEVIAQSSLLGIAGEPLDMALAITYLLSAEARYVSGHTLVVDGGQTTNGQVGTMNQGEADVLRENGQRGLGSKV